MKNPSDKDSESIYSEEKYSEYFTPTKKDSNNSVKKDKTHSVVPARAVIAAAAVILALLIFFISDGKQSFAPSKESSFVISETQVPEAVDIPAATASPQITDEITITKFKAGQKWKGTISVSDYEGEKSSLQNGVIDVTALIDKGPDGRAFFEVYYTSKPEADPILSIWVDIQSKKLVPLIAYDDAWYFDLYLEDYEKDLFTIELVNGSIRHKYKYDTGYQSCNIELALTYVP